MLDIHKLFSEIKSSKASILLVEPYRVKYVPLGLIKLYSYFKYTNLVTVRFGKHKFEPERYGYIFISSGEFSYYKNTILDIVKFYAREYPYSHIIVGGVLAQLDNTLYEELANYATVINTQIEFLDDILLDYSLYSDNPWDFIFTTRGCKMDCDFCYVKQIEPKPYVTNKWESQIYRFSKPYIMVHDNNICSFGEQHFVKVIRAIRDTTKLVMFDNGFDCRFWNNTFTSALYLIKDQLGCSSVRFAFDSMNQDGKIQRAISSVSEFIDPSNILVYILANYSPIEETKYRANEILKLGAYPFIQYYTPLTWDKAPLEYKGEYYNPENITLHNYYNNKAYKFMSYESYKSNQLI